MKFLGYDNTGAQWFSVSKDEDEWSLPSWYKGEGLLVVVPLESPERHFFMRMAERYVGDGNWVNFAPVNGRTYAEDYRIFGEPRELRYGEAWVRINALNRPIDPRTLTETSNDETFCEIPADDILNLLT